ncbi:MAG: hypothetical protein DBY32_01970 [Phascolarctobacterium sp.]|nr:MAG: hypothetical protein DBY32_01970 [Phascolarctobacterium sp.]
MYEFANYTVKLKFKNLENKIHKEVHNIEIAKDKRKCIFCFNEDAKFSKIAHAIPETLGNHSLISYFECDECNYKFGKMFEDDLAKFMMPYKYITNTFGKKII